MSTRQRTAISTSKGLRNTPNRQLCGFLDTFLPLASALLRGHAGLRLAYFFMPAEVCDLGLDCFRLLMWSLRLLEDAAYVHQQDESLVK